MAPEQAEGKAKQVGPLADVYALGAILYELLVGRPPFRGTTVLETLEQVKTAEPVPPSRLVPGLPRDAETIALKCLQKDPAKRYAVGRGAGRGPAAVPGRRADPGPADRTGRAGLAVVPAEPGGGLPLGGVDRRAAGRDGDRLLLRGPGDAKADRPSEARARPRQPRAEVLRRQDYISRVNLALSECLGNNVARALELLDGCPEDLRGWEWDYVWRQCHLDLRTFHEPGGQSVNGVAFSPDGTRVASVSGAFMVRRASHERGPGRPRRGHWPRDLRPSRRRQRLPGRGLQPRRPLDRHGQRLGPGHLWMRPPARKSSACPIPAIATSRSSAWRIARTAGGSSRDTGHSTSPRASATPSSGM